MTRCLTAAVGVLAALAIAACGESTEDKYKDDFPPIDSKIVALGADLRKTLREAGETSDAALAGEVGNYAKQVGDLQQQVDELEPPDDLADDQDQLVSAMGDTQGALEDIAGAAEQGDANAARDATGQLLGSSARVADARQKLARAVDDL